MSLEELYLICFIPALVVSFLLAPYIHNYDQHNDAGIYINPTEWQCTQLNAQHKSGERDTCTQFTAK